MSTTFIPNPQNEPIYQYGVGDPLRNLLKAELASQSKQCVEIPCVIGGKEIFTGNKRQVVMPHSHGEVIAEFHLAGEKELIQAAQAALKAKKDWENFEWQERAKIFLKAADLLSGPWRMKINAATMLGQSKNAYQAEIDSACELIDFLRFNVSFYQKLLLDQPISPTGVINKLEYRPLEGFVLAITPFNFTAIGANLPSAPALLGNTVVWKPSDTQVLSAYYSMKLFEAAGLPPGVINFVPADGPLTGTTLVPHPDLAGIHFTGSTQTFQTLNKSVAENLSHYKSYPRLVGETGGKDFVFAHTSADLDALSTALTRGAFEYQGQKCSAASRAYIPQSIWKKLKSRLETDHASLKMGDVRDFRNFVNAVIDERSFKKIAGYIEKAKQSSDAEILMGGKADGSKGYFIEPTIIQAKKPDFTTMKEEIFGPVLTLWIYDDAKYEETIQLCDLTSPYGLTGAIFAQDQKVLKDLSLKLKYAAGNLYINDKCTGATVGQQPFGGARASGTNDKAGSILNLYRWISPRTIKEVMSPPTDYRYPFMGAE